jgi:hypothetical protein
MNSQLQNRNRYRHTLTIGGRDICRVVQWVDSKNAKIALYDGVTKKEVKKLAIFENIKLEFVCSECEGAGEVACDELDRDSMQYMRGVGTQPCICVTSKDHD